MKPCSWAKRSKVHIDDSIVENDQDPDALVLKQDVAKQKVPNLEVSLAADKNTYKPGDRIKLEVLLVNNNAVSANTEKKHS